MIWIHYLNESLDIRINFGCIAKTLKMDNFHPMGETIIYISLPLKKDGHLIFCICIYSSHISIHTKNQLPSSSGLILNSQLHISDFCHFGPNEKKLW